MLTNDWARRSAPWVICALTMVGCDEMVMCPEGAELVEGECVMPPDADVPIDGDVPMDAEARMDAEAPMDAEPPMDGAPPIMEDGGRMDEDGGTTPPDGGVPPDLPDSGPPTCPTPDTWYRDWDRDGRGDPAASVESCDPVDGFVMNADDCDDGCDTCWTGASELCDSRDNDCNGSVDEGVTSTFYRDGDGDGHGNPAMTSTGCSAPSGFVTSDTDCDDTCAACYPGNTETCDGEDNDCDGSTDEGLLTTYYADADADGHGDASASVSACTAPAGHVTVGDDCDDTCAACYPGNTETCDGDDNDCDGSTDEGLLTTFYADGDGDGHGDASMAVSACSAPSGHVTVGDDCNDTCAACYPGNTEICDGEDNDCDVTVDEGVTSTFYRDADGDGHGDAAASTVACSAPSGYVSSDEDCNDTCAVCYPGRAEVCDSEDNDCDGSTDEGVLSTFYRDMDGDGFGVTSSSTQACSQPAGYAGTGGDCNDACATCNPSATEVCDTLDNDCDAGVDEGVQTRFYRDADGDGHGLASSSVLACSAPSGHVTSMDDCDDTCGVCYPGNTEVCDGENNDCDADVDEGVLDTFYRDGDGDGHGRDDMTTLACSPPSGYAGMGMDCDDAASTTYPGASELCNAIDDDCDGSRDETFTCVEGESTGCTTSCGTRGTGTCTTSCEEPDAAACTPPTETCNYVDDDCDGYLDEYLFSAGPASTYSSGSRLERPRAFECQGDVCAFFHSAGQVLGWRMERDGTVLRSAVPHAGNDTFDVGYRSGDSRIAYAYAEGSQIRVRLLDVGTLNSVRSATIPVSTPYLRVVVDSTSAWVYARVGSWINRYRINKSTGAWDGVTDSVTLTDLPFDVDASRHFGEPHYVSYVTPYSHNAVFIGRVSSSGALTTETIASMPSGVTAIDPAIGTAPDGQIVVAWAERGSNYFVNRIRRAHKTSWSATPAIGTLRMGWTTSDGEGAPNLLIDVGYARGSAAHEVFHVVTSQRLWNSTSPELGDVGAYTIQRSSGGTAIDEIGVGGSRRRHGGVAAAPSMDTSFVVFYEHTVTGGTWRPIGC
ncbi:MAG: putative metal-binding motif-containing protein [Sandaracinaceae bacterium]